MSIDQENLICLVRDRPVIWDNTLEDYKDKQLKFNAWKDICRKLKPDFDDLDRPRKIEFEKLVIKKWTNMKDNWIKYKRKINKCKTGVKNSRKYLYYDKMLFLKKFIDHRKNDSHMNQGDSNDDTSQNSDNAEVYLKGNKRDCEPPKLQETKKVELSERYESSRSMNFFKGVAPTVDKFNDESMIEFQFQVISVIKEIKQREQDKNTAPFSQRTHAQYQYHTPSSSNMELSTCCCSSAKKSVSRSKCRRTPTYDSSRRSGSSFRQPTTNRSDLHSVKVSNNHSDEHSDVDHVEYFDLPSNSAGTHSVDNGDIETEEPVIKIEIADDSVEQEDTADELHSDEKSDP